MTYRPRYEPNEELMAAFTADARDGCAPLTVTFTNITVGDAASAQWEFGDGTTGRGLLTIAHTYAKPVSIVSISTFRTASATSIPM